MTTPPAPVDIAFALLGEGRLADAEDLMAREVREAAAAHGEGSRQWASAQCDLGNVLLNADQVNRAVDCFRSAAAVPGTDHESRKDQLTYRANLGFALRVAGRLDEAEAELRQGLAERAVFYGRDHAGYAFGLEPLADLLLERGDLRQAREAADEAIDNLRRNRHPRAAELTVLRAAVILAGEAASPVGEAGGPPAADKAFEELAQLSEDDVRRAAQSALQRVKRAAPASERLLTALAAALGARLGPDDQATLDALSGLANQRAELGDHSGRVAAIEQVLASYDRQGREEDALRASLGLALAQGQAGQAETGLRSYAAASARAERLGRPDLHSLALRNWGLALREAGDEPQAERRLDEALAQARRSGDDELAGRAGVALGILLQHQERLDEARATLRDALTVLPAAHRDALVGRTHLAAVADGRSCGCDALPDVIADAFREFVRARLPADLLAQLDVAIVDNDFKTEVRLQREPTQDELRRLNEVFQSALAEFRRTLTAAG